jgi:hypothetical protein
MWARVAEELAVPWRAAEAMHWQLGESDMARRAGVVPFSLAAVNAEANAGRRNSPSRAHNTHAQAHLQPQPESKAAAAREVRQMSPHMLYGRGQQPPSGRPGSQGISSRRDSYPTPPRPVVEHPDMGYNPASGLAPIQTQTHLSGTRVLPSIAELTTGVAPYGVNPGPGPGIGPPNPVAPHHTAFVSANISYSAPPESSGIKRRASNDESLREANYRRRVG